MPKGPQLKIQHACRKKLEQLGLSGGGATGTGNEGKTEGEAKRSGDDNASECTICFDAEIQVNGRATAREG